VMYSLPETVCRRSKSMMPRSCSFCTSSTTLRSDRRTLDFALCAASSCRCSSRSSASISAPLPLSRSRRGRVQGVIPLARSLAGDAEDATATARSKCGGEVVTGRWAPEDDGGVRRSRDGRGSGAAAEGRQVGPMQRLPATAEKASDSEMQ